MGAVEEMMCVVCVCVLQRGNSVEGCALALTLCKYDLRKGDLFVMGWAMVRRVRRGSISSELIICACRCAQYLHRCIETIDVYMAHVCFYVCCSDCCLCGGLWECLLCSGRC